MVKECLQNLLKKEMIRISKSSNVVALYLDKEKHKLRDVVENPPLSQITKRNNAPIRKAVETPDGNANANVFSEYDLRSALTKFD